MLRGERLTEVPLPPSKHLEHGQDEGPEVKRQSSRRQVHDPRKSNYEVGYLFKRKILSCFVESLRKRTRTIAK